MDNLTLACAHALCFGIYFSVAYFLYWIFETLDMRSKAKYAEKIKRRREAFELDCQEVGKAMQRQDELQRLFSKPVFPLGVCDSLRRRKRLFMG